MRTFALAICLFASMPAVALAQESPATSLDSLVQTVIANNPERRFYDQAIAAAGREHDVAGRWADPEVSVEFGERRATDPSSGAVLGEGQAYALSVVQPIEFGGRIALRRAIAERQLDLARLGLQQFDATLTARARTLGYGLFSADEKAATARTVAQRMRALAGVVVSRDPSGPAPKLEAAVLEAEAINAERAAATADALANAILYELNQLRGAPFAARIRIIRPDATLQELPASGTLAANATINNFELRSLRAQFAQQGLRVDLARSSRTPTVNVGPYVNGGRSDTRQMDYGVRLSMTVPLWNSQASGVAAEQGRQAEAEATLVSAERRISRQVFDLSAQYEAKRLALARWGGGEAGHFRESAEEADRNYRLGAIPLAIYTQMQKAYLDASFAVLETRSEAFDALFQLRALNGGEALTR